MPFKNYQIFFIKFCLIWLVFLSGSSVVWAQIQGYYSSNNSKAIKQFEEAKSLLAYRKINEAVKALEGAVKRDPNFVEAWWLMGNIYKMDQKPAEVFRAWKIVPSLSREKKERIEAGRFCGSFLLRLGQYDEAAAFLEKVKKELEPTDKLFPTVWRDLRHCEYGKAHLADSLNMKPMPLHSRVNRYPMQYFPAVTADEQLMYFTARKGRREFDGEDLYTSQKVNGEWQTPEALPEPVNTKGNEGTSAISADGSILVFTVCDSRRSKGSCDLFITKRDGEFWSEPEPLEKVNSSSWESQPTLSADGKWLVFCSNRPGGMGSYDLWESHQIANGQWTEPKNMGPFINTPFAEMSPYIHANGLQLYFASEGHPGFGGLDLMMVEKDGKGWTSPANLGYPLNSPKDEAGICITANGKRAFYSREDIRDEQIVSSVLYEVDLPEKLWAKSVKAVLEGKVVDAKTNRPLEADVSLMNLDSNKVIYDVTSEHSTGKFMMVLPPGGPFGLFVSSEGYLYKSVVLPSPETGSLVTKILVKLDKMEKGSSIVLNNLYFESGKYALLQQSTSELDQVINLMNKNPKISIEIDGHTDDVGSDVANMTLSQKRAQAVVEYIIKNNIPKIRLTSKGFGETMPVAPNSSESNRQMNRRIELKIIGV